MALTAPPTALARIPLATLPTPLLAAPNLAAALGLDNLYIKRDDLTGFAFGGNKARPLEFLIAAALRQGSDSLVTGGAAESNFCAAAAAAARVARLSCHLVIAGSPRRSVSLALAQSWGASIRWTHLTDRASVDDMLPSAAAELEAHGHRACVVPRGGATAVGAIGYALAAAELREQLAGLDLHSPHIVVPVGSGGTMAGLVAGNVMLGRPWRLTGASVSRPPDETAARVLGLARECASLLARTACAWAVLGEPEAQIRAEDVEIIDSRGPGHGLASADGNEAAAAALETEGLVVDPVYTAKALAVIRDVAHQPGAVFWHTGGLLDAIEAAGDRP